MNADADALMIAFPDESQARLAADTFAELGYEPCLHDGGRLHIHVRGEDLTSALEIMQSCGGRILERAPAESAALTNSAYALVAIPIPAHTVNEDWAAGYAESDGGAYGSASPQGAEDVFSGDDGSYDHFDAR